MWWLGLFLLDSNSHEHSCLSIIVVMSKHLRAYTYMSSLTEWTFIECLVYLRHWYYRWLFRVRKRIISWVLRGQEIGQRQKRKTKTEWNKLTHCDFHIHVSCKVPSDLKISMTLLVSALHPVSCVVYSLMWNSTSLACHNTEHSAQ